MTQNQKETERKKIKELKKKRKAPLLQMKY